MRGASLGIAFTFTAGAVLASPSSGQSPPRPDASGVELFAPLGDVQTASERRSLTPALLSAALPGAGQHVLGQRRKWVYLAVEAVAWVAYFERRGAGNDWRDRYRDFAWDRARLQGANRVDGDFTYYETLTQWARSGAFDRDAAMSGVQPELDPATFNGSVWALAGRIFLPSGTPVSETEPAYQQALAYYTERAYETGFLWDWSGMPDAQQEFAELIEASDDRFRQATTALGVVIANHLLSAVDAYLAAPRSSSRLRLRLAPGHWSFGGGIFAVLSVPFAG